MLRLFLVLAVFQIVFGLRCVDDWLYSCQSNFNGDLGIAEMTDWHDPDKLQYALDRIQSEPTTAGILKICRAKTNFYRCLGDSYFSCMNPKYFISKGFTEYQAYKYLGLFAYFHFVCGGGLEVSLHNWGCIQHVNNDEETKKALNYCIDTYANSTKTDLGNICCHAHNFLSCSEGVFKNSKCGSAYPDVGWWGCASMRSVLFGMEFCDQKMFFDCPAGNPYPCPPPKIDERNDPYPCPMKQEKIDEDAAKQKIDATLAYFSSKKN